MLIFVANTMIVRASNFQIMPLTVISVVLVLVVGGGAELSGVRLVCLAHASPWIGIGALLVAWTYGSWRQLTHIPLLCEFALIYTNFTAAALIFSYVTLRPAFPLADAALLAADTALGISVPAIVAAVDASPMLSWIMQKSYQSLGLQLGIIPVLLAVLQFKDRAARFLLAQILICLAGCTISIAWPAVGSFSFLGISGSELHNLNGVIGYHFHEGFFAARRDEIFLLTTDRISGVSTFPSIHAALAIACAWALWPVRRLRAPGVVLNAFMYLSTIPVGAHYGVDVAAGTLLAVAALWLCSKVPAGVWAHAIVLRRWQHRAAVHTSLASSAR